MTDDKTPQSHAFQAEVAELLNLMVHSVYSETDVFLRELISNASDACDKLRYEAISRPELLADNERLVIRLTPDPKAGTLAIAFRSIGFVGKLFGEALEEAQRGPIEALIAAGAPWRSILAFGYWPQVKPAFWSIALFRFDINVRESAVLGLIGAGGIGMALDAALNLFQWGRVALILVAILAIVIVVEIAVTQIRKRVL